MHFWNLTIDVISCVNLVIAVGLCVDYAAHIAHTFMVTSGENGNEKAIKALADIGPAVMNGGFSTFLAFILHEKRPKNEQEGTKNEWKLTKKSTGSGN